MICLGFYICAGWEGWQADRANNPANGVIKCVRAPSAQRRSI